MRSGVWIPLVFVFVAWAPVPGGSVPPRAVAASDPPATALHFADATAGSGVTFETLPSPDGSTGYGNGVAVADVDGDGDIDLFFPQDRGDSALYLNDGTMHFAEGAAAAGILLPGVEDRAKAAAFLDYDRDGATDLFVGTAGAGNHLFRNLGDGTFVEVTASAGIGEGTPYTMSAAVGDFNADGFPDVYESNFRPYDPSFSSDEQPEPPAPNRLWRNLGDGTFEDVAAAGGVDEPVASWAAHWVDIDQDGLQDLVVANDTYFYRGFTNLSRVFLNGGPPGWEFEDSDFVDIGFFYPSSAMGVAFGDLDGDRKFDLHVTDVGKNVFFPGGGRWAWHERARDIGIDGGEDAQGYDQFAWGAAIADLDMDGRRDLLVQCGTIETGPEFNPRDLAQRPFLWLQPRRGRFEERAGEAGLLATPTYGGRDAIPADLDGDGDLDLVVSTHVGPAKLFRNDTPRRSDWFGVRLVGSRSDRQGLGSRLELRRGGKRVVELLTTGGQPGGSLPPERILYPGGKSGNRARLVVRWPSGEVQKVRVKANAWTTVEEPPTP
jgi:hypothetical protein